MKLGEVGTHILAEFNTKKFLTDISAYNNFVSELLSKYNVTVVGKSQHVFDTGGYTSCFLLAESHINIHTWPEYELVNLDLFLCNHTENNTEKAKQIIKEVEKFFEPYDTKLTLIHR